MNTSGDVDISPPIVVGGAGHAVPSEEPTSAPYAQVMDKLTIRVEPPSDVQQILIFTTIT